MIWLVTFTEKRVTEKRQKVTSHRDNKYTNVLVLCFMIGTMSLIRTHRQ